MIWVFFSVSTLLYTEHFGTLNTLSVLCKQGRRPTLCTVPEHLTGAHDDNSCCTFWTQCYCLNKKAADKANDNLQASGRSINTQEVGCWGQWDVGGRVA